MLAEHHPVRTPEHGRIKRLVASPIFQQSVDMDARNSWVKIGIADDRFSLGNGPPGSLTTVCATSDSERRSMPAFSL